MMITEDTMSDRYPRIYNALKHLGLSPAKAVEALLDAKRGDKHALQWISVARRAARQ
jgi:hypothetical protein